MDKITQPSTRFSIRFSPFLISIFVFCSLFSTSNLWAKQTPKYMNAVQQEITRLGLSASCQEGTGTCTVLVSEESDIESPSESSAPESPAESSNPVEQISITVDDASNTIRIAIEDFLSSETLIFETAQRLLELNHKLVVAKFSINSERKTVSFSAVVNTDSNFDRKTFRSVLKGFVQTARALKKELDVQN